MERKEYILTIIKKYLLSLKDKLKVNTVVQELYDQYGYYGQTIDNDKFLEQLQKYNMMQDVPYLASGQSGYFHEQIINNGFGSNKLDPQDAEDAKYISNCFGKKTSYSENSIPISYTTLLGTTEFNYATDPFPAGIYEDVFQCSPTHRFPIQPVVGESEENFYLRILEYQIDSSNNFDQSKKLEALSRGKRLIHNFCCHKNKVYLIKLNDAANLKACFGGIYGSRDGKLTKEELQQEIDELPSFSQLLEKFNIKTNRIYDNLNMTSDFGIALCGIIPPDKIQFIEVERKYEMLQRKAIELGYSTGDTIPKILVPKASLSDSMIMEEPQDKHL